MNAPFAAVVFASVVPWSSCAAPALTEGRGCRAGYSLNRISDLCELCPSGTFADSYNWDIQCQQCSICSGGRQMVAACTASSNTVCRCADDHYEHVDGCSPKPRTMVSAIVKLNPILQDLGEQTKIKIQNGLTKLDNLTRTVDRTQEAVASTGLAKRRMQEKSDNIKTFLIVIVVMLIITIFLVVTSIIIQRNSKLATNVCCHQQGRHNKGVAKQSDKALGGKFLCRTEKPSAMSPEEKTGIKNEPVITTTTAKITCTRPRGSEVSNAAAATTALQGSSSNMMSIVLHSSGSNRGTSGAADDVNGMAPAATVPLLADPSGLTAAGPSGCAGTEKPSAMSPEGKTGRKNEAVITTTTAEIAWPRPRGSEASNAAAATATLQGSINNILRTMLRSSEPNRRASGAADDVYGMAPAPLLADPSGLTAAGPSGCAVRTSPTEYQSWTSEDLKSFDLLSKCPVSLQKVKGDCNFQSLSSCNDNFGGDEHALSTGRCGSVFFRSDKSLPTSLRDCGIQSLSERIDNFGRDKYALSAGRCSSVSFRSDKSLPTSLKNWLSTGSQPMIPLARMTSEPLSRHLRCEEDGGDSSIGLQPLTLRSCGPEAVIDLSPEKRSINSLVSFRLRSPMSAQDPTEAQGFWEVNAAHRDQQLAVRDVQIDEACTLPRASSS